MIGITGHRCEVFHSFSLGASVEHAGQGILMAAHSLPSTPGADVSHWQSGSATCNRAYMVAAMRAGAIALVLLGILALIVLF